jgi:hypothetical protein
MLAYLKSSAWETVCRKLRFNFNLLKLTLVPSSSQQSLCSLTYTRRCSFSLDVFALPMRRGCSNEALL